ncbi:flippase [Vibrio coralliirubri]|uniref:flippase n=1 Tax=Vibrio coralliirubri TaxID=1516159 RepID=UPI000A3BD090|nr:flippase [Vibrio coralliirubri]
MSKKYLSSLLALIGDKVVRILLGLFVGVWIARYLGPEEFGRLSYTQSIVAFITAFCSLGLEGILTKKLTEGNLFQADLLGTSLLLRLSSALFSVFIVFSITPFFSVSVDFEILLLTLSTISVFQSFSVFDSYLYSKVLGKFIAINSLVAVTLSSIAKVTVIILDLGINLLAFAIVSEFVFIMFGTLVLARKLEFSIISWTFDIRVAKDLMKDSLPLMLSSFVIIIYMKIDTIMISKLLDERSVGVYSAATKIAESIYFIPMVISSTLLPYLIKKRKISNEEYNEAFFDLYTIMSTIAFFLALMVTIFSESIISILFGSEYIGAASVLSINIWCSIFVFLGVSCSKWFIIEGLQKLTFYRTLLGAFLNVVLNFFAIPNFGIEGAAFSTLISQCFSSYLFNYFTLKTRHVFFMQTQAIGMIFRPHRFLSVILKYKRLFFISKIGV